MRRPKLPLQFVPFRFACANPPPTFSSIEKTAGGFGMRLLVNAPFRICSIILRFTDQELVNVPDETPPFKKTVGGSPDAKFAGLHAPPPQPVPASGRKKPP